MTRIVQHLWEAIRFERRLLQRLQEAVLRDEVLDYTVERLREELQRRHEALSCQLLALREERRRIQCKIANLVEAIASRKGSPNLMAAIADREEKIREITDRLIEPGLIRSNRSSTISARSRSRDCRISAPCLERQMPFAKPARYWLNSLGNLR